MKLRLAAVAFLVAAVLNVDVLAQAGKMITTTGVVYVRSLAISTATFATSVIIGAATTSGVRLDLENGNLAIREGDDSAYVSLIGTGLFASGGGGTLGFVGSSLMRAPSDGVLTLYNNAAGDFSRLQFGGTTSGFPALKRNGNGVDVRTADDSGYGLVQGAGFYSRAGDVGIGYAAGAGGIVTQATSKSTGVTLNKVSGEITMNAAALAADTTVSFVVSISSVTGADQLVLSHVSGGTLGAYTLNSSCATGSCTIYVRNVTAGSLSEAIVIKFNVFKGATT